MCLVTDGSFQVKLHFWPTNDYGELIKIHFVACKMLSELTPHSKKKPTQILFSLLLMN